MTYIMTLLINMMTWVGKFGKAAHLDEWLLRERESDFLGTSLC